MLTDLVVAVSYSQTVFYCCAVSYSLLMHAAKLNFSSHSISTLRNISSTCIRLVNSLRCDLLQEKPIKQQPAHTV